MEQTTSKKQGEKIAWIDTAKGLCLFLVVFGHLLTIGTWQNLKIAIYSFHMPMYFILAGWLMKPKNQKFSTFLKEKFFRILLPAIVYLLVCLPISIKLQIDAGASTLKILEKTFYYKGRLHFNVPVWFLLAMFQVLVIAKIIRLEKYKTWGKFLTAFICFALAYVFYNVYHFPYFGIDKAILCLGFYSVGGGLCAVRAKIKSKDLVSFLAIISTMLWLLFSALMKQTPSLYGFKLDNFFYFILTGIFGSIMWFKISSLLSGIKSLTKFGRNTLLILGSQYYWYYYVRMHAVSFGIAKTYIGNIVAVVFTLLSMIVYYYLTDPVNKYLPFLNGIWYKDKKKEKLVEK